MRIEIANPTLRMAIASILLGSFYLSNSPLFLAQAKEQSDNREIRRQSYRTVSSLPNSAKRYALIIGIDDYDSAQINRLEGASNDAKSLADVLIKSAGFPSEQVILLTADQPVQRRPTRNNILGRL